MAGNGLQEERFPIVGPYNKQFSIQLDPQETVNLYIHEDPTGKSAHVLAPTPGLEDLNLKMDGDVARKLYVSRDGKKLFVVSGNTIYLFDSRFNITEIGRLTTDRGIVSIKENEVQIIFVDGIEGWIYTKSTGAFERITDAGFPGGSNVVSYQDGFFIANEADSNQFHVSNINDGTKWNALEFAKLTSQPDNIIGFGDINRHLFIMGNFVTEVWSDAGTPDFPFRRVDNMLLAYGCAAPRSIAIGQALLFWLARDENGVSSVVMTDGTLPKAVSTPSIDSQIKSFSDVEDATAFVYKENGHVFYQINFTTANVSFLYNVTTDSWSKRMTYGDNRHIAESHAYFFNEHLVCAYNAPKVMRMSQDILTDNGSPIPRIRISHIFSDQLYRNISVLSFYLDLVQGTGSLTGNYVEPKVFLSISTDGGESYGQESVGNIGKIGLTRYETTFSPVGGGPLVNGSSIVFKVRIVSENEVIIMGATIQYEVEETF